MPVARLPAMIPAPATAAVPWMSSLKQVIVRRYRSRRAKAVFFLKSSHCSSAFGKRCFTAWTNSSTKDSYGSPRRRGGRQPTERAAASRPLIAETEDALVVGPDDEPSPVDGRSPAPPRARRSGRRGHQDPAGAAE